MATTSNNVDVFVQVIGGGGSSTTLFAGAFGDGSDGDATISTTVTTTREWHYNNLTITGTGVLKPRGHRIFVKGTLTINAGGSINDDGNFGGTGASGGAALTNISTSCLGAGSGAGGAGRTTTGVGNAGITSSNCSTNNVAAQPIGGVGGGISAPVVAGGSAGPAPVPTISQKWNSLASILSGRLCNAATFNGGSGGGGGALEITGGTGTSGNGGSGGGIIHIGAKTVVNNGSISANGGAGGNGVATGTASAGGGAGGGGGLVALLTTTTSSFGTVTANAGTVGTGAGIAPTAATVGQPGSVAILVLA